MWWCEDCEYDTWGNALCVWCCEIALSLDRRVAALMRSPATTGGEEEGR